MLECRVGLTPFETAKLTPIFLAAEKAEEGMRMKTVIMLAMVALGLAGCSTCDDHVGPSSGYHSSGYQTSTGQWWSADNGRNEDTTVSEWKGWPYGGNPDRIAPRLPLDPEFPPSPTPPVHL